MSSKVSSNSALYTILYIKRDGEVTKMKELDRERVMKVHNMALESREVVVD